MKQRLQLIPHPLPLPSCLSLLPPKPSILCSSIQSCITKAGCINDEIKSNTALISPLLDQLLPLLLVFARLNTHFFFFCTTQTSVHSEE